MSPDSASSIGDVSSPQAPSPILATDSGGPTSGLRYSVVVPVFYEAQTIANCSIMCISGNDCPFIRTVFRVGDFLRLIDPALF